MKLSIITICYNIKDEIERTCESIVNQSYQDFEWIVVDGGSTDGTLDILNRYKDRIDVFISERDKGVYDAMNKGILSSKGEYLEFVNGGDHFYDKEVLAKVVPELQGKDIYYGDLEFKNDTSSFLREYPDTLPFYWFKDHCLGHITSFIKKTLFDCYGLYNPHLRIVSDWEKWVIFISINQASYEHVSYRQTGILATFYTTGISVKDIIGRTNERRGIVRKYYGFNKRIVNVKKWCGVPWLKSIQSYGKTQYLLFGFLPILTVKGY